MQIKSFSKMCSRAGHAGANKNSYRTFLTIEITLRDHTRSTSSGQPPPFCKGFSDIYRKTDQPDDSL